MHGYWLTIILRAESCNTFATPTQNDRAGRRYYALRLTLSKNGGDFIRGKLTA